MYETDRELRGEWATDTAESLRCIADALERISPPHGWKYEAATSFSQAVWYCEEHGYEIFKTHVLSDADAEIFYLRCPRQAPVTTEE